MHWADGPPTELDNLMLLCTFHHHTVHEGGWRIDPATGAFVNPHGYEVDPKPQTRHGGSSHTVDIAAMAARYGL